MQQMSHVGQPADVWAAAQMHTLAATCKALHRFIACKSGRCYGCRECCSPEFTYFNLGCLEASSPTAHLHIQELTRAHLSAMAAPEEDVLCACRCWSGCGTWMSPGHSLPRTRRPNRTAAR